MTRIETIKRIAILDNLIVSAMDIPSPAAFRSIRRMVRETAAMSDLTDDIKAALLTQENVCAMGIAA